MPRVEPLTRGELAEFEPFFAGIEQALGFVPNSLLTLGRSPALLRAFAGLSGAVLMQGQIDRELKQLVAFVSSNAAGCRYCQAHTSHSAERLGVPLEKLQAAFEFETSPLFSAAERAALQLAQAAGLVPNASRDDHFVELRRHFDETQIVEIVSVIALFGWLNRWNDTMATELESGPLAFAEANLARHGWKSGRHAAG
ncbi:MAG: carboxymuconolactone decarboxylase family protein [Deltaproteobacteria bacterium]|nr:carboxymuconolactone decarboxylase family protein [Deltaproteobacteria bacterium]MBW2359662.1 carboxymuconolactone decarboxylase family protein [Deltaproteobacteria bacterium]